MRVVFTFIKYCRMSLTNIGTEVKPIAYTKDMFVSKLTGMLASLMYEVFESESTDVLS